MNLNNGETFFDKTVAFLPINKRKPEALFIGCMEKRLVDVYPFIMINYFGYMPGSFFKKTPAGSVGEIVHNQNNGKENEINAIKLAIDNGISKVIIAVHTDCAADGGSGNFANHDEEIYFQWKKAENARKIILENFSEIKPDLEVELMLLDIKGDQVYIIHRQGSGALVSTNAISTSA